MYSTSSQKRDWTFTAEALAERRERCNQVFRDKQEGLVQPDEVAMFLSTEQDLLMTRIVEKAAIKFSDSFEPPLWPSVRWTAYMYFKRLFLEWSVMDASPKIVMMACFYLAMKTDEFFVTIDEFVGNLRSGTAEQNTSRILGLEPEIMRTLNYQLTVHCPFRPFEGHLMEMKARMLLLNFDLESVRGPADEFFRKCLVCDVMLMYPPSQIALAAIKYGLTWLDKSPEVLREFVQKLLGVEDAWKGDQTESIMAADKLINRLDEILECVKTGEPNITSDLQMKLQESTGVWAELSAVLETRRAQRPGERSREDPVDSDDD